MCLVNYDQRRARSRKAVTTPLCFDVVEADDCVGMSVEQSLRCGQAALQAGRGGSGDSYRVEIEFLRSFACCRQREPRRTDRLPFESWVDQLHICFSAGEWA